MSALVDLAQANKINLLKMLLISSQ